ncbi:GNAT family N-acetyltransferase [Catellatospora methionotrophica]|uniref:GNAT family N-acetyltransferase n=1 Tax=Catellatospora methionotrophica TaxID=121620 RepID=UPI0033E34A7E
MVDDIVRQAEQRWNAPTSKVHDNHAEGPVYTVRRLQVTDWRMFRSLRLEALADTPLGFGETLAEAERLTDADWWHRAEALAHRTDQAMLVAAAQETLVGMAGVRWRDPQTAEIVAVYVTPRMRGQRFGLGRLLLDAVHGHVVTTAPGSRIVLYVHPLNARALTFYNRNGFALTGEIRHHRFDARHHWLQMASVSWTERV